MAAVKPRLALLGRVGSTALMVAVAGVAAGWLWNHYQREPWTRDGRIRADVAEVAPDVSGLVTEVHVRDNSVVRQGAPLFVIDRPRYVLALQQAAATLAHAQASLKQSQAGVHEARANLETEAALLAQAHREDQRNGRLGELVPIETVEQGATRVQQLAASVDQARAAIAQAVANAVQAKAVIREDAAALDVAALNLERTTVRAPVDGVAADVQLRPGDYLTAGRPAFGLVDLASLHIDGYFEETKLGRIHVGDPATVRLMGDGRRMAGHVESLSPGIEDRERTPSTDLLANVNPTFNWVRLAQRIPVRIHIDRAPADLPLIAGRTATVIIDQPTRRPPRGRAPS